MGAFIAVVAGVVFAVGLGMAGMTRPDDIIGFLDITGDWKPAVLFVMVGAIAVYGIGYRFVTRRPAPLFGAAFQIPTRRDIDWRLVVGAVLFGVGWGLGGYCPGPALASVGRFTVETLTFTGAMVLGMGIFGVVEPALARVENARR